MQASSYLNKLPKSFDKEDKILVADPMLATGAYSLCSADLMQQQHAQAQAQATSKELHAIAKVHLVHDAWQRCHTALCRIRAPFVWTVLLQTTQKLFA